MGFAITEPDAGSDAGAGTTSAVLEGDEWVLNGSKVMIGNGSSADFMLVFCLTDPDSEKKSRRHSIILVETDRKGYEADQMHGKMGLRASDTSSIYFTDLRVPKENLIGERGRGFSQLMNFFDRSRAWVGSQGIGLAQGAMEMAIEHVKNRQQFGRPLASFQVTQFKIAEMATKIELARTLVYRACWMVDHGKLETAIVAMSKWNAGRMAVEVVDEALQLHGGYGYFNEQPIERFYRAAKVLEIYEGTKEVEKIIIGRSLLR
jgi:alkylation response protein AidB-like acyl-CoA dehydrogenase